MIRTVKPRSEDIRVYVDRDMKRRLEEVAEERGWSLSLLCHDVLKEWLDGAVIEYTVNKEEIASWGADFG